MAHLPLEGLRVIDFTVVWAGPLVTKMMAELGAEVIRVESKEHFPSSTKGLMAYPTKEMVATMGGLGSAYPNKDPGPDPYNRHAMFNVHAINKLSCTMELDRPEGMEAFERLVKVSDILVENNAVRVGNKLGLDWEHISALNPRMILVRMPPLGLTGPYANALGFGAHFEALSGVTYIRGYRDADPSKTTETFHMDDASAHGVLFAVLAALHHREKTGRGQMIEFPQAENMLQQMGEAFLDYSMNGRSAEPHGNTHPFFVQGCYPCKGDDQWIVFTLENEAQWQALLELAEHPAWGEDPRFATPLSRRENQDALDPLLASFTQQHDKVALFHLLQRVGIPAAPIYDEADAYRDPQFSERGFFKSMTHLETGTHLYPSHLSQWSGLQMRWETPPPMLGQHNAYVYKEVLGYSEEEYQQMLEQGLIGTEYARA
ncbi:MAG: CoA transferase [Firmicutes bacterium]|nr:CoA transferase [Bacillota bacterium]